MSGDRNWKPASNPWLIAMVVTLAAFMEVLDTTIVNVALPHISGTMSASYDEATWTLTSYLVANGIALPLSAYFSKLFGRKRYFLLCIVGFTVCSLLSGISTALWQLVLFRILQGFCGGGLQPTQQSIILDTFPVSQRGHAFSISAVAIVVAPVLGPTLGGWITDNFTWRWVFLLNVPIGIITAIAVMQVVEDPPWEKKQDRSKIGLDLVGIGLITLGLGCLQVFLDRGEDSDWFSSSFIVTFAALSAIGIVGASFWLLYAKKPVVDLRVLKDRNFVFGSIMISGLAAVLYGSAVLIPQLAQQQLGYTATLAGLVLSPGALLIIMVIPIVSKLMQVVQTRHLIAFGFFLLGCALIYSRRLVPDIDFESLVMIRTAQSAAIGFMFVPVTTLAYLSIPAAANNDASALFTMFRNVAGSVGISLSTSMIQERTQANMGHMAGHLSVLNPSYNETVQRIAHALMQTGQTLAEATTAATGQLYKMLISQASLLAYLDVFLIYAVFSFLFIPFTFFFSPVKASAQSGGH
jgi:DHA2 family multidrug resistance protein